MSCCDQLVIAVIMNINELREKTIPCLVEVYEKIYATSIMNFQAIKDNPAGYCWKDYLAPIADTLPADVKAIREHYEQTKDKSLLLDLCRAMGAIDIENCIEHLIKVFAAHSFLMQNSLKRSDLRVDNIANELVGILVLLRANGGRREKK